MSKKNASINDLNPEQAQALREFATKHGKDWKDTLLSGWLRAAYPGPLQQIRNQFGPVWLSNLKEL